MNQILIPAQLPTGGWFGRRPPQGLAVCAAFGARAILLGRGAGQEIDIPYDRKQTWPTDAQALPAEFRAWLHSDVMRWLRAHCQQRGGIDAGSRSVFTLRSGLMTAEASPQASFGYLYIGAWMALPETAP
jgi:hypothetical protein